MAGNLAYALSEQDYRRPPSGATLGGRETLSDFGFQQRLARIIDEFRSLMALPPNWDSYGARRINEWSIQAAYSLLLQVMSLLRNQLNALPCCAPSLESAW